MHDALHRIRQNLAEIRERIAAAAARSGRPPSAVTLVGVTKYVSAEVTRLVAEAGCPDLGESRPQQLWEKAETLAGGAVRWHLIGHLQRNKARRTVPWVHLVHSADSARLLEALDEAAAERPDPLPVLLEVNISGDAAKYGFTSGELPGVLAELPRLANLRVRGLMGMGGLESSTDQTRAEFASLRELRDRLQGACPPGVSLDELSMGMSGDYEMAIEEGATLVRVGSALVTGVEG